MRAHYVETTPMQAHAVKTGDRLKEKRTAEVRQVSALGGTITRRVIALDDGTYIEVGPFDTLHVTHEPVTPTEGSEQ